MSSDSHKRTKSLLQQKPEVIIDVGDKWKHKKNNFDQTASEKLYHLDTKERFCQPASNVKREPEDGCMKKIKIERSLKLHREDMRGRETNLLSNGAQDSGAWINSFGNQKELYLDKVTPGIELTHAEKRQIASSLTPADLANDNLRVNMDYSPKKHVTHESSRRYSAIPKDNGIW